MPTLNWIGKDKIITHHNDVPFKLLEKKYTYGAEESENMIIHGDNLESLKSLLPRYEGGIKCIYIDPPYNTGKKDWVYNDNVDDPRLLKWLGEVVGPEGDDLSRHDKWLCMMYPRLKLLHKLLSDDGAIFISIDDNELFNLKLICDEIFGPTNYGGLLSVEINPKGRKNSDFLSVSNDYCLIYLKNKGNCHFLENIPKDKKDLSLDENGRLVHNSGKRVLVGENSFNRIVEDFSSDKHYTVYYNKAQNNLILKAESSVDEFDENLISQGYKRYYSYINNNFVENTYSRDRFLELYNDGALDFKEEKIYEKNFSNTIRMKSILVNKEYQIYKNGVVTNYKIDVKTTSAGTELKSMFGTSKPVFENSKNKFLIELLISLIDDKNCTILDCFAGSGTTGHAVLDLNNEDGGNRKFILIEMMDYAENITARRCKISIDGYKNIKGLPGSFSFYELAEPIFLEDGNLNPSISDEEVKKFIYYTETHKNVEKTKNEAYMGTSDSTAYYIFYKKDEPTTLNYKTIDLIDKKADAYVIYADTCTLSESFMEKNHIIFKKIPRDIQKI